MPVRKCCVCGCLHNSAKNRDLTFFSLPVDPKRRATWLPLIDREDLSDVEDCRSFTICEVHFKRNDIAAGSRRKLLKQRAVPVLYLPVGGQPLPRNVETRDCATQTNIRSMPSTECQTAPSLVWPPLRKRAQSLVDPPSDPLAHVGLAEMTREDCENDADVQTFFRLCDKLLTRELAALVKLQTVLKLQNKVK